MEESVVRVENLSHKYSSSWAIQNLNFEIRRRGVLGLLGSNGAGKSTTMNIMCGVLNQTSGNVFIDELNLRKDPEKAKKKIGFLPQLAPLHLDLTVDEYLTYCGYLRSIPAKTIPTALNEVKERCGVNHFSKRVIRNLSGGYKQRVGIAQAIIHKPDVVVLDEATNGLDPIQILEVRKLIKEIAEERAVIFSSHILSEVQVTCKEIIMIENGKMVFYDSMDAFNNYLTPDTLVVKMERPPKIVELKNIENIIQVTALSNSDFRLKFKGDANITKYIIKLSVEKEWCLTEINLEKGSLDEIFAQLSKKNEIIPGEKND